MFIVKTKLLPLWNAIGDDGSDALRSVSFNCEAAVLVMMMR